MTVSLEQKETAGEEVEQEELEPEEDSSGFGILFSIISLTIKFIEAFYFWLVRYG